MRRRTKIFLAIGALILLTAILYLILGSSGQNEAYQPQNEFKLDDWIPIHVGKLNLSFTKAVLYLWLASGLTVGTLVYVARRMQARPNRVQTTVELAYLFMRDNLTRGNMDTKMARRWFPFVGTLFLFIWWSNMIGYVPLPTGTEHYVGPIPQFVLYSATANLAVPLALTLMVWFSYQIEGVRAKGFVRYLKSWIPDGVEGFARIPIFGIEVISHFVRIISLSVRLFANMLAGHLLILFMGGGLVILLGLAAAGVFTIPVAIAFYLFEVVLIATLQAFIFAVLTAIYLGGAVAEHH